MFAEAVLLECPNKLKGRVIGSSGVMLDKKFVLTTSHIVHEELLKIIPNIFDVGSEQIHFAQDKIDIGINVVTKNSLDNLYDFKKAQVFGYFTHLNIKHSNKDIFSHWAVDSIDNNRSIQEILSLFVILRIEDRSSIQDFKAILRAWLNITHQVSINKGDELYCVSTPFGNRNFLNTHSRGIVSNIFGDNNCMILTDCSTVHGSEGSPVYLTELKDAPIGIVTSSLSWWKGEWVGLTLVADIRPLLLQLLAVSVAYFEHGVEVKDRKPNFKLLSSVDYSLAQVYSGSSWGTAILLNKDKGIFITNSHVIQLEGNITLYFRGRSFNCRLIYKTPEEGAFDLAILQCNNKDITDMEACILRSSRKPCSNGDTVFCAGFSLFPKEAQPTATVTRGHVARIHDHMLQTTCAVHAGSSGGAVLNKDGELVGVIVCNTKVFETGAVYPRINMAVPVEAFRNVVEQFIQSEEASVLETLGCTSPEAFRAWKQLEGKL